MPSLMRRHRALSDLGLFAVSLFAAVSFSLGVLYARLFAHGELSQVIYLQTATAFCAFVIQSGLRAGLRKEWAQGRRRIVEAAEQSFQGLALLAGAAGLLVAALLPEAAFHQPFALGAANAVITLSIGLRTFSGDLAAAAKASLTLLAMNVSAAAIVIFVHGVSRSEGMATEALALLVLLLFVKPRGARALTVRLRRAVASTPLMVKLARRYIGLQVTSFALVAGTFVLSLVVIEAAKGEARIIQAYAEATLVSGVLGLLISRATLIYEARMLQRNLAGTYLLALLGFSALAATAFAGWREWAFGDGALGFVLLYAHMGQLVAASVSQYVVESYRKPLLLGCFAALIWLLAVLLQMKIAGEHFHAYWLFGNANVVALMAVIMLWPARRNALITMR